MANWDFYTADGFLKVGLVTTSLGDADTLDGFDSSDFILKAGDSVTGTLTLSGGTTHIVLANDPTIGNHATRQSYTEGRYLLKESGETDSIISDVTVDAAAGGSLIRNQTGDTPIAGEYVWTEHVAATYLPLAGGTMTGALTMNASLLLPVYTQGVVSTVTVPETNTPSSGTHYALDIDIGGGPVTVDDIDWDADAATVQSAIEAAIPTLVGNVAVTRTGAGTLGDPYVFEIEFTGDVADNDVTVVEVAPSTNPLDNGATLTVAYPTVTIGTVIGTDHTVLVNSSQNPVTVQINGASVDGQRLEIRDIGADGVGNAATNNITIDPNGSTVDGSGTTFVLDQNGQSVVLVGTDLNDFFTVAEANAPSASFALDDLSDVTISSVTDNSILKWDQTGLEWINTDDLTIDDNGRLSVPTDGPTAGIAIGSDVHMYRSAADTLRLDNKFFVDGGLQVAALSVSSSPHNVDYNAEHTLFCETGTSAYTINLVTGHSLGDTIVIKDKDGNAANNNITVSPAGGATIDGKADLVINKNYSAVTLQSDGTDWFIV